jgi:signal transduction histidine kinase
MKDDAEKKLFKPEIIVRLRHGVKTDLIEIKDNGVGIKDEDKLKIFGAFFTTKPSSKSGSGIGVYVVKRMIEENHKGKIWFKSQYLQGTSFFIELPNIQPA